MYSVLKYFRLYIIPVLAIFSIEMSGQIVDTSKSVNTWKLMHNYSRFEHVDLDTTIFHLHKDYNPIHRVGFAYENLGIIGSAAQNIYFFDRPLTDQFLFGSSLQPYLATPDRTVFYNTRKPFTELVYSNIPGNQWGEETVRFLHTQNMDPFSNIGIDFELLSGKELYKNEESRVTRFTLFTSRAKEKYSSFGTFHLNRFSNKENGGLENPGSFSRDSLPEMWLYPVNLGNASSSYSNLKIFFTQKFNITEKSIHTDSLGISSDSGRNFSFNHQFVAERNSRFYKDKFSLNLIPEFYDNFYYYSGEVMDSVLQDQVVNTFQFILGDPYTDKLSARIYAGHEFARYGQRSPSISSVFSHFDTVNVNPFVLDSVFKDTAIAVFKNEFSNDLFAGFYMAGPPERTWYWNVDAKYYLAGYYRNNFTANATFARTVFTNYQLGLRGNIENRNVSFFHNNYSSAFFQWQNDFKAAQLVRAEAFLTNRESRFDAVVSTGILTNYLYWDENALPAQYDKAIYIFTGKIFKHFKASGFNSYNQLLIQYTSEDKIVKLPLVALKTSNFWEQSLFKGALIAQVGVDFYITTSYQGYAYMPATGIFHLQNNENLGGYPFSDLFLGLRIKRTRLFGSYNNAFGLINKNYFTATGYPTKAGYFRLGLAWTFYD